MGSTRSTKRISWITPALAASAALALSLSGCGGIDPNAAPAASGSANAQELTVGIFVDNAFGDGDFFDQAAVAEKSLPSQEGAKVTTYEGQLQSQNFGPLLQDAADANKLVFVLGFEAIDAMIEASKNNPDTTFVFVDGVVDNPEIVSAQFRTAEGCFMAGALAATVNTGANATIAGFIGGVDAPVVVNCLSGYKQGVSKVSSAQTVASQYVGSFVDPAKGSEIATSLANQGAYSIFSYAGLSGAGAFDAAKSGLKIAPIGVVADKSALAPGLVPGSLTMGVDKVILDITKAYKAGALKRGTTMSYGFAEGGWAMTYDKSLLKPDQVSALDAIEKSIVDGTLVVKAD